MTGYLLRVLAVACAILVAPSASALTINDDRGGQSIRYVLKAKLITRNGGQVRFTGRCYSACTALLSVPASRSCVTRDARFGFHATTHPTMTRYLMRQYPAWVRQWLRANGGLTRQIKRMPAAYAARHIGYCD